MEFSIKYDTVQSVWFIVYIEGLQVIIFKKYYISFVADPDEILPYAAFHLGLHCWRLYPFRNFQSSTV